MTNQPPIAEYASPGMVPPRKTPWRGLVGWMIFVGLAIMFFMLMRQGRTSAATVSFGQFQTDLIAATVQQVTVSPDEVEYTTTRAVRTNNPVIAGSSASVCRVRLAQDMGKDFRFIEWLLRQSDSPPDIRFDNQSNIVVNLLLPLIPWLLIFGFIWFFVLRQLRNANNQRWQKPTPVVIVNPEQSKA